MKAMKRSAAALSALALGSVLAACSTGPSASTNTGGSAAPTSCAAKPTFTTLQDGTLQIAGMNEMPSFLGSSSATTPEGFGAELMQKFADQNCLKVAWTPGTGPATQLLTANGKVDAWVGIIIASPAREQVLALEQHQLYFEFGGIASKSADNYTSIAQLKGKTVGAVTGSQYVTSLQEAVGKDNVKLFQSSAEAYDDLAAGRLDAVFTPSTPQGYWVSQNKDAGLVSNIVEDDPTYPVLTQEYRVVWPVMKANTALRDALNTYFTTLNDSGELKTTLAKYGITNDLYFTGR